MRKLIASLACAFALLSSSSAQEIKILGLNGDLWSTNARTGEIAFIGLTGQHIHFWNSFANDSQGRLYGAYGEWFAPYAIYEINPSSGVATFVAQTSLTGIRAMAFDDNDVLHIANERDAPLILSPTDIHTIDLSTGVSTLIGEAGVLKLHTLDFWEGDLFGYALNMGLCKINLSSGIATDVNPGIEGPWGVTSSMCFDAQGALYYLNDYLWLLDRSTGGASLINPISLFGFWADAVFVEGPVPNFTLWLSGAAGGPMGVEISGATPHSQIGIAWARGGGGPTPIPAGFPCAGVELDLNASMRLLGVSTSDLLGNVTVPSQFVPSSAIGLIRMQAIDLASCSVSNRVIVAY